MTQTKMTKEPSSFRDHSGYVYMEGEDLYRSINPCYLSDYSLLVSSGLYDELTLEGLLIPHEDLGEDEGRWIIKPRKVGFISYPYEWSFGMLKDAALVTLEIQKRAMDHGMVLKDASAYNIQFVNGRPTLIDTLSFSRYVEGEPWVAYRQFCQHFINPLALMSYSDIRLGRLLSTYIDGIPSDITSKLLPVHTLFRPSLLGHIHFHSLGGEKKGGKKRRMRKVFLQALINNLESTVKKLKWGPTGGWSGYKKAMSYGEDDFERKKEIVSEFLRKAGPRKVWDLGSNLGEFSEIATREGAEVIAFDMDPACVETHYRSKRGGLPLLIDLTNPSPGIGWENRERKSLTERGPADIIMALALIHHLAIGNNVPLDRIAEFFSSLCRYLIIEFVPKADPQVQKMLENREDIFDGYAEFAFAGEFGKYFKVMEKCPVGNTGRTIYLMGKEAGA